MTNHNGHFRIEYSCGHVHSQCRCVSLHKRLTVLQVPCPDCKHKETECHSSTHSESRS
jgi:hypothetical protein